ncbi:MAG: hypothetical protein AB1439_05115 [candidate division FCPU426 bacterium]
MPDLEAIKTQYPKLYSSDPKIARQTAWDLIVKQTHSQAEERELWDPIGLEHGFYADVLAGIGKRIQPDQHEVLAAIIVLFENPLEIKDFKAEMLAWLDRFGAEAKQAIPALEKLAAQGEDQRPSLFASPIRWAKHVIAAWTKPKESIFTKESRIRLAKLAEERLREMKANSAR